MVSGRAGFFTGAALAGGAAVVLPPLAPLPAMMLLMAGDPDEIRAAARQWGGESGGAGLRELGQELTRMATGINASGDWKGTSHTTFSQNVSTFQRQLDTLENQRQGVAGSLNSAADLYDAAGLFCFTVGGIAAGLGGFALAMRAHPAGLAMLPVVHRAATALGQATYKVNGQMLKTVLKASAVLGLVTTGYGAVAGKLPGMEASIDFQKPEFASARLAYNPALGGLGPSTDPGDIADVEPPAPFKYSI